MGFWDLGLFWFKRKALLALHVTIEHIFKKKNFQKCFICIFIRVRIWVGFIPRGMSLT